MILGTMGLESIKQNANIIGEIFSIIEDISATTNTKSRTDLFGIPDNE